VVVVSVVLATLWRAVLHVVAVRVLATGIAGFD
jgi:hypothetical protein